MSRIKDILTASRDLLADPQGTRWSQDQLLRFLSEGHKELAKKTLHCRDRVAIPLIYDQHTYNLPKNLLYIKGAWYKNKALHIGSISQLNRITFTRTGFQPVQSNFPVLISQANWQEETSENEIRAIITENENFDTFRVYPIPRIKGLPLTDSAGTASSAGILAGPTDVGVPDSGLGDTFVGKEGPVMGDLGDEVITIDYSKIPDTLQDEEAELHNKEAYDIALKYYVAYQAFLTDTDLSSVDKANLHLQNYLHQVEMAKLEASTDNIDANQNDIPYRPYG